MSGPAPLRMRAYLLANRIETRGLARAAATAIDPIITPVGAGQAFVFRNGAAAFIGLSSEEEHAFIAALHPRLREPFEPFGIEDAEIVVRSEGDEQVLPQGAVALRGLEPERLIVVADVLAKAAALNYYEPLVERVLERIEPLARELAREGRTSAGLAQLSERMGEAISVEIRLVARSAVAEKPEILWDHPQYERLYARLETEYELRDRALILERKLDTLRTTSTFITELIQNRNAHMLEWAIIWLIVFEIALSLYGLFFGGGR